ncbi:MAG: sigma-70 family RNA polymerase sigma factor [Thermoguttaceae bacterium]|nr:sigma-70 family RNA polymerase sigma factor [Thermoguttaceae bacterium]
MRSGEFNFEEVLKLARSGDSAALGALLENFRNYLLFLARLQIDPRISGKVDAADLVQEAFLEAYQAFPNFRGETEVTFLAWLRQILATTLASSVRYYVGTKQRDVRLEREIYVRVDQSSMFWNQLVSNISTPSLKVSRQEMENQLVEAMAQLPEHYRDVLRLRHSESLPFQEIADRLGRTVDSVQKIWVRALAQLRDLVSDDEGGDE